MCMEVIPIMANASVSTYLSDGISIKIQEGMPYINPFKGYLISFLVADLPREKKWMGKNT